MKRQHPRHICYLLYKFSDCADYAIVERIHSKIVGNNDQVILHNGGYRKLEKAPFGSNIYGYAPEFKITEIPEYTTVENLQITHPEYFL